MHCRLVPALALAASTAFGCVSSDNGSAADGIDDIGLGSGKADGSQLSNCESTALLSLVNSNVSPTDLEAKGVNTQAATNVVAHRDGADGMFGTADDDPFDSLEELDAVPYVGPVSFQELAAIVTPSCTPLDLKGHCTVITTAFTNGYGYPRTTQEPIELTIQLDPANPTPVDGGDPVAVRGTVHVDSPWGSIPAGLWRAWCHLAHQDYQPLDSACAIGPYDISTGLLGFGQGFTTFRHGTDGYTMFVSAHLESPHTNYYDDYTKTSFSCSLP